MELMLPIVVSLTILIVLLLGGVVFLAVLFLRMTTGQMQFLVNSQAEQENRNREQMNLLSETIVASLETTSSAVSESQQRVLQHLTEQQARSTQLLQKTVEAATFGASSSVETLAKLVRETTTFLATKEPMAYQMAMGAQSMQQPGSSADAYTSTDANSVAAAEESQRIVDQALGMMAAFSTAGATDGTEYPKSA